MSDLKGFVIENGVLTRYKGKGGAVVIPDGVTSIGIMAFSYCENITTINIPDGVTSIGYKAFYDCKKLSSINIPDSVTSIGKEAFYDCKKLSSINIPDGVTSIGDYAFCGCTNLTTINIPDSVTSIGGEVFLDTAYYKNESNWENDVLYIGNHLIKVKATASGELVIKPGTKTIAGSAFEGCTNLTTINIPDSVTSIGGEVFLDTAYYKNESNWENGALYIGNHLIKVKDNVSGEFIIKPGIKTIADGAFERCTNLTTINIPDSVTSIGNKAFRDCENLTTITIPDSVTSIGDDAFWGCKNLTTIILPSDITTFKGSVIELLWHTCEKNEVKIVLLNSLLSQYFDLICNDADLNRKIKSNKKKILETAIKVDNAESIEKLFSLYPKIKLDDLNECIEKASDTVQVKAFLLDYKNKIYTTQQQDEHENDKLEKDLGLKERTLSDWKKIFAFDVNGDEAIITGYKGSEIDVVVPANIGKYKVVGISSEAFSFLANRIKKEQRESRKNLKSVVLPNSITSIGKEAFYKCESLTTITIPEGVTSIGDKAFYCCKNLVAINIPKSVKIIGEWAFRDCENLTTITIPDSVTSIGYGAFDGCTNLTTINISDSVTSIGDYAFCGCTNLTTITIPDSVTSIGGCAFDVCSNLTTINIPDSVTSIGSSAFEGCENLTIHAPAGSYAEKYAKENKINFVAE